MAKGALIRYTISLTVVGSNPAREFFLFPKRIFLQFLRFSLYKIGVYDFIVHYNEFYIETISVFSYTVTHVY